MIIVIFEINGKLEINSVIVVWLMNLENILIFAYLLVEIIAKHIFVFLYFFNIKYVVFEYLKYYCVIQAN